MNPLVLLGLGLSLAGFAYTQFRRAKRLEARLLVSESERSTVLADQARLLNAVSHELRTPLARLRFALELIELASEPEGRRRRIIEAGRDLDELEGLVRDLLRHQALEAAPSVTLQRAPVDLVELIGEVVEDGARLRPNKEIAFLGDDDLGDGELDGKLLRRALGNLVSNAARYADARVEVRAHLDGDRLKVHVDDDGPGVPVAQRDLIFAPFHRLDDARSRDTGGSGLGLPIAIGVARAHGGTIIVSDSPLGGARFTWDSPV